MSEWIRCSRKKPPRDADSEFAPAVLLYFPNGGDDTYNLGYYDPIDRAWMAHDGGGVYELAVPQPTHWMAIEPPQRGSKSGGSQ